MAKTGFHHWRQWKHQTPALAWLKPDFTTRTGSTKHPSKYTEPHSPNAQITTCSLLVARWATRTNNNTVLSSMKSTMHIASAGATDVQVGRIHADQQQHSHTWQPMGARCGAYVRQCKARASCLAQSLSHSACLNAPCRMAVHSHYAKNTRSALTSSRPDCIGLGEAQPRQP